MKYTFPTFHSEITAIVITVFEMLN